ncbi:MAG: hypothetical protein U0903_07440 [Planctomycetales bacterium]
MAKCPMPKIQISTDGKTFDIEVPDDATEDQIRKKVIEFLEARKRFHREPRRSRRLISA